MLIKYDRANGAARILEHEAAIQAAAPCHGASRGAWPDGLAEPEVEARAGGVQRRRGGLRGEWEWGGALPPSPSRAKKNKK